jgi:hypothetical protein
MIRSWLFSVLIGVALAACARGGAATLNEPIQLAPGEWANFESEQLQVKFVGIDEDSRCPNDVACVWAGEVVVRLTLRRNSRNNEVAVRETQSLAVDGYEVSVLQVLPPRASSGPVALADYRITLKVTR